MLLSISHGQVVSNYADIDNGPVTISWPVFPGMQRLAGTALQIRTSRDDLRHLRDQIAAALSQPEED